MRIYITGVSGFVGGRLAEHFLAGGHSVLGCGSSEASRGAAPEGLERFDVLRLGEDAPSGTFADVDAVIHGAYVAGKDSEEQNVDGTESWRRQADGEAVGRQLFLTSHSADADATSAYGRQKYALEERFLEHGHTALRLGLVIGDGGLFRRMLDLIWKLPVLPLLDGGRAPTPVTSPTDLARAVEALLQVSPDAGPGRAYHLFNAEPVPLRDLLRSARRALGARTLFLPIPSSLLLPPLIVARKLRIPLPVDEENVRGYRSNRERERASDLASLIDRPTPFDAMAQAAAADYLQRIKGPRR